MSFCWCTSWFVFPFNLGTAKERKAEDARASSRTLAEEGSSLRWRELRKDLLNSKPALKTREVCNQLTILVSGKGPDLRKFSLRLREEIRSKHVHMLISSRHHWCRVPQRGRLIALRHSPIASDALLRQSLAHVVYLANWTFGWCPPARTLAIDPTWNRAANRWARDSHMYLNRSISCLPSCPRRLSRGNVSPQPMWIVPSLWSHHRPGRLICGCLDIRLIHELPYQMFLVTMHRLHVTTKMYKLPYEMTRLLPVHDLSSQFAAIIN